MADFPEDVFTAPKADPDTLRNLGPLRRMAGVWEGMKSLDVHPGPDGPRRQVYHERIELQPMDPQTNGPQLLYGLHYVTRMVRPGAVATYHHQTGYWLWEPATGTVIHTLTIPLAPQRNNQPRPPRKPPAPLSSSSSIATLATAAMAAICRTAAARHGARIPQDSAQDPCVD